MFPTPHLHPPTLSLIPTLPPLRIGPFVPLRLRIKSNQCLRPHVVLLPQKLRDIHIERGIRLGARQELMYRGQGGCYRVSGRPGGLEEVEANLAGAEVDVGVADWSREFYGRRGQRVGGGDGDEEEPAPTCVGVLVLMRVWGMKVARRDEQLQAGDVKGPVYLHMQFQGHPSSPPSKTSVHRHLQDRARGVLRWGRIGKFGAR
jgi:hypothetical protein